MRLLIWLPSRHSTGDRPAARNHSEPPVSKHDLPEHSYLSDDALVEWEVVLRRTSRDKYIHALQMISNFEILERQRATIEYLNSMVRQMAKMAEEHHAPYLACLLEMAHAETCDILRGERLPKAEGACGPARRKRGRKSTSTNVDGDDSSHWPNVTRRN